MRKSLKLRMTVVFCAVLLIGPSGLAMAASLTLRLSHPQPETHIYHRAALFLARELEKNSGGAMKLEVFPNSLLGGERNVLDLIQAGAVDLMATSTPVIGNYDRLFLMFSLPFLFDDEQHLYRTFEEPEVAGPLAESLVRSKGARPLAYWLAGPRNFCSVKPVNSLADFKSARTRCMEDALILATYRALGAVPVALPFPDVFTALETGTVSAAEIPLNTYIHNKFYKIVPNAAHIDVHFTMMLVLVSEKIWSGLTDEQKEWLKAAAAVSEKYQRGEMEKEIKGLPGQLKALGVNVTYPDRAELRKAVEMVYDNYARENPAAAALAAKIRSW